MPTIVETILVKRRGKHLTLEVDGKPFPWHVAADDVLTATTTEGLSTVTLTQPALHVTVDDDAAPEAPSAYDACPNHQARQHRDGKEPWCHECGRTEDGREPITLGGARFGR